MEEKKEKTKQKENLSDTISKEVTPIDNNTLSINELIKRIDLLSKNKNPYSVSKEIEEIKSIFYIKLNLEKKEKITSKEIEKKKESSKKELHPLEVKFKGIFNTYRKIKSDFRKTKEKEEKENLKTKRKIIEDIDILAKEEESIKTTFEKFKKLQEKWKNTGHVPITKKNDIWQSYHHHIELFYDFMKLNNDLRDLDFKRNFQTKTEICKKAELLLKEKSLNKAHEKLQELHEHWRNVGPVERKEREPLWEKFQKISTKINKKRNDYFVKKKKEDLKRLNLKNDICLEIEKLISTEKGSHKEWKESSNECKKLEEKWKSIGRLEKKNNRIAWEKLRTTLTKFYDAKNTFYKEKKKYQKEILRTKLTLCEKAENLQNSTNWKETTKEIIKLQKKWQNLLYTPSKQSNELWERFRTACNIFFKIKKSYYKEIESKEKEAHKEKLKIVEKVKKFKISSNPKEDIKTLEEFSLTWGKIGQVPKKSQNIDNDFINLLDSKFESLGLDKKEVADSRYKNKINSLKGNKKAISREQEILKQKISSLKKEIMQYENNISFFENNKSTKPLLKKAQKKIDNAKTDIKELKQKMQLIKKA